MSLRPARPAIVRQAREAGMEVIEAPSDDLLWAEMEAAEIVQVHFWNSPELLEVLYGPLPPSRVLLWCHIGGATAPQLLTADAVARADLVIGVTPLTTRLEHLGGAGASAVIPGALDPHRLAQRPRVRSEGFTVGYLGTVSPVKMHPDFVALSSAVDVPGVRFVVCGAGNGFDAIAREADLLGTRERFDLRGFVEDVGSVLRQLDVFGYPLQEDNYSGMDVALAEAMYCGVPPVVLPHGGTALAVVDGESGIVARDGREYVTAVENLAHDPDLRARLAEGARSHAEATFSPDATRKMWHTAYEELMTHPKHARAEAAWPASGAARFLAGLGGFTAGRDPDHALAEAPVTMIESDGGVLDYRRRYPDDPDLRLWSGLGLLRQGRHVPAAGELAAAVRLGCDPERAAPYLAELAELLGQPIEVA